MGQGVTKRSLPMLLKYTEGPGEESSGHPVEHSPVQVSRKEGKTHIQLMVSPEVRQLGGTDGSSPQNSAILGCHIWPSSLASAHRSTEVQRSLDVSSVPVPRDSLQRISAGQQDRSV